MSMGCPSERPKTAHVWSLAEKSKLRRFIFRSSEVLRGRADSGVPEAGKLEEQAAQGREL